MPEFSEFATKSAELDIFIASVVRNRARRSESRQFEEGPEEPPKIPRCKRFAPRAKFPLAKGFILC